MNTLVNYTWDNLANILEDFEYKPYKEEFIHKYGVVKWEIWHTMIEQLLNTFIESFEEGSQK